MSKYGKSKISIRRSRVRVKSSPRRSDSSTRWLQRQLNDPYVVAASSAGYRSRAAFKLIGLDERFNFLRAGQLVLDLGAAPGGWSQVAIERTGGVGVGRLWAVDISDMKPISGANILRIDLSKADAITRLHSTLGTQVDLVLSDMAPPAMGHAATDHLRTLILCEKALSIARSILRPKGSFVTKILMGGSEQEFIFDIKTDFQSVKNGKPQASRRDSSETYIVARGFKRSK